MQDVASTVSNDEDVIEASDNKQARVEPAPSVAATSSLIQCSFCDDLFIEQTRVSKHERTCVENPARIKLQNTVDPKGELDYWEAESQKFEEKRVETVKEYKKAFNIESPRVWHTNDIKWIESLAALKMVKEATGTAWMKGTTRLAKWCQYQRGQYKKKMKGQKTALSDGRIKLLNNIGFPWGGAEVTIKKTKAKEDKARVVSPSSEEAAQGDVPAIPSPYKGTESGRGIVVSPFAASTVATDIDSNRLKDLLLKCELEQYLFKFQSIQVTSAAQLLANLQDVAFMQRLVQATGMSATEAVKLQIIASKQESQIGIVMKC
mmetsp:Transcript_10964/g.23778  ORF Transcript_10964/g.23778 Transcript_10964/m.23778 type:complete len:320 (+) Transcript_10964:2-961(+)